MNLATKTKKLATALLNTHDPKELAPTPLPPYVSATTRSNEELFFGTAIKLMISAFQASLAKGLPDETSIHNEIDRRIKILGNNWKKIGHKHYKEFKTPQELQEALKIADEMGISITPKKGESITPECTLLELYQKDYMAMRLIFEGRMEQMTTAI